jgi:hypothetical protein
MLGNIRPGLKRLAKNRQSSLFDLHLGNEEKVVYNKETCSQWLNLFSLLLTRRPEKLDH